MPPVFSALVNPEAEPDLRGRFVPSEGECDAERVVALTCTPDEFPAALAAVDPDRIVGQRWDGRKVAGRSILVGRDSARIGETSLPLADLERLWLETDPTPEVYATMLAVPAVTAGLGGLSGLGPDGPSVLEGAAVGAGIGLALAVLARPRPLGRRFEVVGWAPPPRPDNRLDADADGCASEWYPARVYYWEPDCIAPDEVEARATANWVRQVDVVLRNGTRIEGTSVELGPTAAALDGRAVSYAELSRIELRAPPPPLAPLRTGARWAFEGGLMGAAIGSGVALAYGDPNAIWQSAAIGAAVTGMTGAILQLAFPRQGTRDVYVLPEP